jgi:hypothetical protein
MGERITLTREQYLESIGELRASAVALGTRLSMAQMTWQPGGGEHWSVSECIDHIAISTDILLDAMEPALMGARPGPGAPLFQTSGFLTTKFILEAEPPVRRKLRAPAKIRPRVTLNPEGIMPRFLKSIDRVAAIVVSTAGKDLNAVRFPNPLIPLLKYSVAIGFLVIGAHGRRHIWQAEQALAEPDFPG